MRALRAVRAILRTCAGFYREQAAELNFFRLVEFAMRELRLKYQFRQRKIEDGANFIARPVMANWRCGHAKIFSQARAMSSISTRTSRGRRVTSTVARAGGAAAKYLP